MQPCYLRLPCPAKSFPERSEMAKSQTFGSYGDCQHESKDNLHAVNRPVPPPTKCEQAVSCRNLDILSILILNFHRCTNGTLRIPLLNVSTKNIVSRVQVWLTSQMLMVWKPLSILSPPSQRPASSTHPPSIESSCLLPVEILITLFLCCTSYCAVMKPVAEGCR